MGPVEDQHAFNMVIEMEELEWPGSALAGMYQPTYCEAATVAPGQMPTPRYSSCFRRLQPRVIQPSSVSQSFIQVDQNQAQTGPCVVRQKQEPTSIITLKIKPYFKDQRQKIQVI